MLPFVRERKSITGDQIDTGENASKLDAFMKKLGSNHHYQTFTNREDLAGKVAASIHRAIQSDEEDATTRSGWIRGDAIPANALEELARLSKKNASLRDKVEALGDSKKAVFELLLEGKPLPPTLPIEIPEYRLIPDASRNFPGTFSAVTVAMSRREKLADASGRLVWLDLSLRNGGTGIARNVVATLTARSVRELQLHRLSVSDLTDFIPRWITNPVEHVYVDRHTTKDKVATVQQRIRTLGIGQTEKLIRMGFVLDDDFTHAGAAELNVDFEVRSEEGECSTGAVRVDVLQGPEKEITEEELEKL